MTHRLKMQLLDSRYIGGGEYAVYVLFSQSCCLVSGLGTDQSLQFSQSCFEVFIGIRVKFYSFCPIQICFVLPYCVIAFNILGSQHRLGLLTYPLSGQLGNKMMNFSNLFVRGDLIDYISFMMVLWLLLTYTLHVISS